MGMIGSNDDLRPQTDNLSEPYPLPLPTKSVSGWGSGRLPTREQVQARFLHCAWHKQMEEVEESASDLVLASAKILMTNILEAATRLRRNFIITPAGFTHSYGTTEEANTSATIGRTRPHSLLPNKSKMTARDIMEAARFDRRLKLNSELRTMLNRHLDGVEPPKAKRKKISLPNGSNKRAALPDGSRKRVNEETADRMDESAMSLSSKIKIPFIIGVAGGTASGKSSVCAKIIDLLGPYKRRVISISQDSFYRNLTPEENIRASRGDFNFDHPDSFEHSLMLEVLESLRSGKHQKIPKYDFVTSSRLADDFDVVEPADVIIVEGILVFYDQKLRDMFNMKLFVDADSDIRLARRVERDTKDRGRTLSQVLHQYLTLVKPAFEEFCLPTKKYADVVIPRGTDNLVAINLIVQHIQEILRSPQSSTTSSLTDIISESGIHELSSSIPRDPSGDHKHKRIPNNVTRPH